MKTPRRILLIIAGICLIMACSKSDLFWKDNSGIPNLNKSGIALTPGDIFTLTGDALYTTWKVIDGEVVQEVAHPCTGELEILDENSFRFSFQETPPGVNGMTYFGKLSASGEITFQFPAPLMVFPDGTKLYITDVIKSHGCVTKLWGPGINEGTLYFIGRFDGTRITAEAKFMAMIEGDCTGLWEDTFSGPVHWVFGYDLALE